MADERDYSIWAQNAGTTAAALIGKFFPGELTPDILEEYLGTFDVIRAHVFEGTITLTGLHQAAKAEAAVLQVFPGSTVVPPGMVANEPFPPGVPPVPVYPPPVPAVPAPPAPLSPPPAPPAAAAAQPGGCPTCGSKVYDNRAENVQRVAQGQKARPAFKCSNQACGYIVWKV